MRNKLLIGGLAALCLTPAVAGAQPMDPACVRSNQQNQAAGTIMGAIGGAILGGALSGRHDRGAGVAVGAAGGAIAGGAIAGSTNQPCPAGYYYAPPPPPPPGFWDGAPQSIGERIDMMQGRIDRSAQSGWLAPREIDHLNDELNFVRSENRRLHAQDYGPLRPEDRAYLQQRLDYIAQQMHWMDHRG